jgi:hypothetical protein
MSIEVECPSCKAKHKVDLSPMAKAILEQLEQKIKAEAYKPEDWLKHAQECETCGKLVRKYFPEKKEEVKKEDVSKSNFPF